MILRTLALMMVCRAPDDGGGGGGGGGEEAPKVVPVEALQAERKARQELEARLTKIEADRKAAEDKAAADAGEYRKLYEPTKAELETAKARLAGYEAAEAARAEKLQARNEARVKALPEAAQKAAKALVGKLSPEDLAEYLDEHGATFGADPITRPAGTLGNGAGGKGEPIPAECKAEWEKYGKNLGVSERDWFERNWKPRHSKK